MFLTGSVGAGKAVMKAAAEHLTPVLLELGGQNPAIVDETANLPDAAEKIVLGAMAWGGQWCTSPGYVAVHESVAEEFVAQCKKAVAGLYGKDPKNNSDYSRTISPSAVKKLASMIDSSKVFSGGKFDESAMLPRPDPSLPRFLVRQSRGRRNLRSDLADPDLFRSRGVAREDQVVTQVTSAKPVESVVAAVNRMA
jgi:hypothetical protein